MDSPKIRLAFKLYKMLVLVESSQDSELFPLISLSNQTKKWLSKNDVNYEGGRGEWSKKLPTVMVTIDYKWSLFMDGREGKPKSDQMVDGGGLNDLVS